MFETIFPTNKDIRQNPDNRRPLGELGEKLACEYLIQQGYRIVIRNFKVPVGRNRNGAQITGEIDVIALDDETLCFVEVKARTSDEFAPVTSAVNTRKQRQIVRTARIYRRLFEITDLVFRYDVVTVLFEHSKKSPSVELHRGFWNEEKFRKRAWQEDTIR